MNNKVLVNIYVPLLEKKYEVFLPANKKIGEIIILVGKALNEISGGYYHFKNTERLYNRINGREYPINQLLKYTSIRNSTELIFM